MGMSIVALLCLVAVIAIAIWKQYNLGIMAVAMTLVLCLISGTSTSRMLDGFNGTMFARMAFGSIAFGALRVTGAAELLIKKIMKKFGSKFIPFMPWFFFLLSFIPGIMGMGAIATVAIVSTGAVVGVQLGIYPILIPLMVMVVASVNPIHPVQMVGIMVTDIIEPMGYSASEMTTAFYAEMIFAFIICLGLYIIFKGYKVKKNANINFDEDLPKFEKKQLVTLVGTMIIIAGIVFFKLDIGLLSAFMAVVYLACGVYTEKTMFQAMPLNVMFTVASVGVLVNLVVTLGGIDLVMSLLNPILNKYTIVPLAALVSGLMSWMSSTVGVVIPTLLPLVPALIATAGGDVSFTVVLTAILMAGHVASMNPFDGTGGTVLAYAAPVLETEEERKKLVPQLLYISLALVGVVVLISATGLMDLVVSLIS